MATQQHDPRHILLCVEIYFTALASRFQDLARRADERPKELFTFVWVYSHQNTYTHTWNHSNAYIKHGVKVPTLAKTATTGLQKWNEKINYSKIAALVNQSPVITAWTSLILSSAINRCQISNNIEPAWRFSYQRRCNSHTCCLI